MQRMTTNGTASGDSAQIWWGRHFTEQEVSPTKYVYNYAQIDENHQRTPMCRIAELARYNKIRHEYKLMDESGPAHKKQFTVSLVLTPDQASVFYGKGASIKKAQQSAAETALNGTTLPKPPDKAPSKKTRSGRISLDFQNPIVLLRYVAGRLGVDIKFIDEVMPICPIPPHPITRLPIQPLIRTPFLPMINDQFLVLSPPRIAFDQPHLPTALQSMPIIMRPPNTMIPPQLPFFHRYRSQLQLHKIRLILSKEYPEFIGKGATKKRARNSAANQALSYLGPYLATLEAQSKSRMTNGSKNGLADIEIESIRTDNLKSVVTTARNGKPKSSISQIHECALQMRMNVLKEEGPAHDRHYLLRCKLISAERVISADGEGSSKKIAKQNACSLMLTKLQTVESSPIFIAASMLKSHKKIGPPRELKRKTISKDMKMNPEYGHQINPISRLMQVMQARKRSEPKFQLVAERGQSRYKEFVMEVTCDDGLRCEGTGPNKKLAKRAAAEAVLTRIGYVKPMPKPGKSLLKKKSEDCLQQSQIGVFKLDRKENLMRETNEKNGGAENAEKVSEVTLSVTASMGSQVMAFAGVDRTVCADERGIWGSPVAETKGITDKENEKLKQQAPQSKRRVTFSNEVSACPPPDDSNYPSALITPLKSEVVVVNKLRRKGRDSKKWLTEIEKKEVAEMAQEFFKSDSINLSKKEEKMESDGFTLLDHQMKQLSLNGNPDEASSIGCSAKLYLESIGEHYKFSINYTDFPVVCHGSGNTEEAAHEDAARNALLLLCKIWMVH
uniref:DRBM domain-containing protein n=1 Tax=Setaria digitata TaxID=48799 RepID=A0A915Q830_9BILA